MQIDKLFELMISRGASDLHLRAGQPAILRVNKRLEKVEMEALSTEEVSNFIFGILDGKKKNELENKLQCDFSYVLSEVGRFRGAAFCQKGTLGVVFRAVPDAPSNFRDLKLPVVLEKICQYSNGIVLVTGPAGSGKSTTLAAMVNHINEIRHAHIVTLEDPIEYIFKDKNSVITQRELGIDMLSYLDALKNIVRTDPDIIMIGEMRDIDTISAGISVAEVGNLVLSSVHTINAFQTVSRIIDFYPVSHQNQVRVQLSETLRAVISMRLMMSKDGSSLVPVCEIMINTEIIKKRIAENNLSEIYDVMAKGSYYGMQTFNQALVDLCQRDVVTQEEALKVSTNPEEFSLFIRGIDVTTAATGQ